MRIKTILAAAFLAVGAVSSHADSACGKVEFIWQSVTDGGLFKFKLIGTVLPFTNTFRVSYNSTTSPMILSNVLTAKAGYFTLCVDYNPTGTEKTVNFVNTMLP